MFLSGKNLKTTAREVARKALNVWVIQAFLATLVISLIAWPPVTAQSTCTSPDFATKIAISPDFCQFWFDNGGISIFGQPITTSNNEISPETGQSVPTQWFERARFELRPKAGGGTEVALGKLGTELRQEALNKNSNNQEIDPNFRPATPLVDPDFPLEEQKFFDQTKHNVRFKFLDYWNKNGGEARFGLPISEEHLEFEPETHRFYVAQWFERARLEFHPENPPETEILLGQLGSQIKKAGLDNARQKRLDFDWKTGRNGSFLDQPNSVFVDGTGNIYVNDRASGRVNKYNSKFELVNYWYLVGGGTKNPALEGGTQAIAGLAKKPNENNNGNGTTPAPTPTPTPKPTASPTPNTGQEKPPILYSLAPDKTDVVRKLTAEGNWETIQLQPAGDADANTPNIGLAVGSGESLYILKSATYANFLVFKYTNKGEFITKFVRRGDVNDPTAIAVSGDKIYLADGSSGKYFIFDGSDKSKGDILTPGGISLPNTGGPHNIQSIAVDPSGNVLVGENGKITRFDINNSGPASFPVTAGRAVGQLLNPVGMTTDLKGNLYVADPANHRVIVVDQAGNPRNVIQSDPYNLEGNLGSARSVVITSGTNAVILVADPVNQRIEKFDITGKYLSQWTSNGVSALAISPAGEVYALNTSQAQVTKFDLDGKQLAQFGKLGSGNGEFRFPNALAVGKDNSLYVADTGNQRIQKFDDKGTFQKAWGAKGAGDQEFGGDGLSDLYSGPTSIAVEPASGNLYVVDSASARILKFDPNGQFLGLLTQANIEPNRTFEPVAVAAPALQLTKQQSGSSGATPTPAPSTVDDTGLTSGIYIMALKGIYKLDAQDQFQFSYFADAPLPGTDGGDGNVENLTGIAVDNNGNIFTTDNFSRLSKFHYK
ncbi:MAG: hypothetical protein J0I20_09210 [Chloroflexi bacterium]|nr:hypothetical protein [Chloroflexota bacterium]